MMGWFSSHIVVVQSRSHTINSMDVEKKRITVALFQGNAKDGDVEFNLDMMKEQIHRAASAGAELIIFPELFLSGYHVPAEEMKMVAEQRDGPSFQELSKTAKESNIAVLYGYPQVDQSNGSPVYYNSAQLIDRDGSSLVNYNKTHLWIPPEPPQFELVFTPGRQFQGPVECCGMRIGVLICMDLSITEAARCLALSGANFIAVPTASSLQSDRRKSLFFTRTRALENGVYLAYVNHVGGGLEGCSQLCNPDGTVVVFSGCDSEAALLLGTVVLPITSQVNYLESRRPELYKSLLN